MFLYEQIWFALWVSGGSNGKESASNVGDLGSIPGLGRSPGGGKSHGGHFPWSRRESDTNEWLTTHTHTLFGDLKLACQLTGHIISIFGSPTEWYINRASTFMIPILSYFIIFLQYKLTYIPILYMRKFKLREGKGTTPNVSPWQRGSSTCVSCPWIPYVLSENLSLSWLIASSVVHRNSLILGERKPGHSSLIWLCYFGEIALTTT